MPKKSEKRQKIVKKMAKKDEKSVKKSKKDKKKNRKFRQDYKIKLQTKSTRLGEIYRYKNKKVSHRGLREKRLF